MSRTIAEPLVLRAVAVDGSITILQEPEDRELSIEELEQLARWQANQPARKPTQRSEQNRGGGRALGDRVDGNGAPGREGRPRRRRWWPQTLRCRNRG